MRAPECGQRGFDAGIDRAFNGGGRCGFIQFAERAELGDDAGTIRRRKGRTQPLFAVAIGACGIDGGDARIHCAAHERHGGVLRRLAGPVGGAIGKAKLNGPQHKFGRPLAAHRHDSPL